MFDVAIVGGGIAGMATAARLQTAGRTTVVLEAHGQIGGCAGFFRRRGFSFDVGATTLVDFEPGGVGGELLEAIGMERFRSHALPGYVAWLPDRVIYLHRESERWAAERLRMLGSTAGHQRFWQLIDNVADVFWRASRRGAKLPLRSAGDVWRAVQAIGLSNLPLIRWLGWTVGDVLRHYGLRDDRPLVGLLSMLIEDTVHSTIDEAPFINAVLGITIRGAGLTRANGGMRGFWQQFVRHYRSLGGELRVGCKVERIARHRDGFELSTSKGIVPAQQVVSAIPASITMQMAPSAVQDALRPFVERDANSLGGAFVAFLGVPDEEVSNQPFTHHQLLHDYDAPLGLGNNMFISVSSPEDVESAPTRHRTVMISTHCDLDEWQSLTQVEYSLRKSEVGERLIKLARRVYPDLGRRPLVQEFATPQTFARFTSRIGGAVGGVRQTLLNANQNAMPHDFGVPGFYLVGDNTWPGLGTVACVLGSRLVAELVLRAGGRRHSRRYSDAAA